MLKKIQKSQRGFTLPELMISTFIITFAFTGIIVSFFHCMYLNEMSQNSAIAITAVKDRISGIENTSFTNIVTTYDNTTFTTNDLTGIGITTIDNSNPDVLIVTLSFSWRQGNGRIIGEDTDLDGQLDFGEDTNGNGELDSPVKISTSVYNI